MRQTPAPYTAPAPPIEQRESEYVVAQRRLNNAQATLFRGALPAAYGYRVLFLQ